MSSSRMIYVNLPVADLPASVRFFKALGFAFDERFTDEAAACMTLSDQGGVMLLTRARFGDFTSREICDPQTQLEALFAITAESRQAVDAFVAQAIALGGSEGGPPMDYGFMYQRSFLDVDGHHWEVFHMDMDAIPG